jgi:predicted transcriptional regulator
MPVKKLSVALEDDVADAASKAAARSGLSLSAWLNTAAEHQLAIEAGIDAVRAWEADHGPLTPEELAAADRILDDVFDDRRAS